MEANCIKLTERILQLTLEIIYLLTGEDNIVVKKTLGDGQNSIVVPLQSILIPERNNEQKILEVTKKMIELLTGEMGNGNSFDIVIKEEIKAEEEEESVMKEWEYLERHKDLYKDVMIASQSALTSPDGSSNGNPPERCPHPLYSRDSTQEDPTIPQNHQSGNLGDYNIVIKEEFENEDEEYGLMKEGPESYKYVALEPPIKRKPPGRCPHPLYSQNSTQEDPTILHHHQGEQFKDMKVEVKEEEEEMLVSGDQPSMEEGEMMVTSKQEESSLQINANYSKEDSGMVLYAPSIVTQSIHHKRNDTVRSTDWFNSEESKHSSRTVIPNVQASFHSTDRSPDPSNPEESSPNNVHPFEDCETSFVGKHDFVAPQRFHTSKKLFSCYMCENSFMKRSELIRHYRTHARIKPFSCDECGKCFHEKSKLIRHHRVHTGEKPYPCPACGKCFSEKGNCDKHMRIHTGEKPFVCPECNKCFAQKVALIIHQGTHISQNH